MTDAAADATVHLVARLVPQAGKADELAHTIMALVPQVRSEPGCIAYLAHESLDEPGVIVMIEAWANQAALDTHAAAPGFAALAARFEDLLATPPSLERLRRIVESFPQ
ncbi:putative quinol monooxygenase [Croceicoccus mobilis]|uniref:Antibiotic biosynthesis monooxygenase n=1 Tax=Croceicoccus mobilis TaxID=1703339 RepID=A0A917E0F5_9SPHN|nr:putative quinol monooxygenase [Croceicoccus mobilis]GGD85142.1 antibiotic biosynthesis monooxygenase [Croceicoccus mobilis]